MITEKEYEDAIKAQEEAEKIILQYNREDIERFDHRMSEFASGKPFTLEELRFSRVSRCPCGAGLAYPKNCPPMHYWDCSAILTGTADKEKQHCAQLPFMYYEIKSENEKETTRPTNIKE